MGATSRVSEKGEGLSTTTKTDGEIAEVESRISAYRKFFDNDHLLWVLLSNMSQGELLRLQCVSRRWKAAIESSYELCSQVFRPHTMATDDGSVPSYRFNVFVSDRIRWSPAMELDQINSSDFKSVQGSPCLQAMAIPGASWRSQLICWPAVFDITVSNEVGVEEGAPLLRITCPYPADVQDTSIKVPDDDDDIGEVMKLNIRNFPHNEGKVVNGITFEDLLYATRQQYIEYDYAFEAVYEYLDLETDVAGQWATELTIREDRGIPNLEAHI
ncbi:hypothetical protein ACMFMF_010268 [Clarireedia jacksonii]